MARNSKIRFGQALRKAREGKGVKLNEVASLLGVSVPFLSDVENGRRSLSNDRTRQVAEFLDVDALPLLELAARSRGKIVLDTQALDSDQLRAVTLLAMNWPNVSKDALDLMSTLSRKSA